MLDAAVSVPNSANNFRGTRVQRRGALSAAAVRRLLAWLDGDGSVWRWIVAAAVLVVVAAAAVVAIGQWLGVLTQL